MIKHKDSPIEVYDICSGTKSGTETTFYIDESSLEVYRTETKD